MYVDDVGVLVKGGSKVGRVEVLVSSRIFSRGPFLAHPGEVLSSHKARVIPASFYDATLYRKSNHYRYVYPCIMILSARFRRGDAGEGDSRDAS